MNPLRPLLLLGVLIAAGGTAVALAAGLGTTAPAQSVVVVSGANDGVVARAIDRSNLRHQLDIATGVEYARDRMSRGAAPADIAELPDEVFWDGFELCGDGVIDSGAEQCDRSDLGGATCSSLGYPGGALSCTRQCQFDRSGCAATCASLVCTIDGDCGAAACGPCLTNLCIGALGKPPPGDDP